MVCQGVYGSASVTSDVSNPGPLAYTVTVAARDLYWGILREASYASQPKVKMGGYDCAIYRKGISGWRVHTHSVSM